MCSDDEDDEEHLDWLSIAPEMDEPEEPGWGQLEVSYEEDRWALKRVVLC